MKRYAILFAGLLLSVSSTGFADWRETRAENGIDPFNPYSRGSVTGSRSTRAENGEYVKRGNRTGSRSTRAENGSVLPGNRSSYDHPRGSRSWFF
jgi:hypothetical protein